jgi:hypothetical protein
MLKGMDPLVEIEPTGHGIKLMVQCQEIESTHKRRIHSNTDILSCRPRIVDHRDRLSKRCIMTRVHKG